jgi:hypothetical protein
MSPAAVRALLLVVVADTGRVATARVPTDSSSDGTSCSGAGTVPCAALGLAASGWACCSGTPPVGSIANGTCGHTGYSGDCDTDPSGA